VQQLNREQRIGIVLVVLGLLALAAGPLPNHPTLPARHWRGGWGESGPMMMHRPGYEPWLWHHPLEPAT